VVDTLEEAKDVAANITKRDRRSEYSKIEDDWQKDEAFEVFWKDKKGYVVYEAEPFKTAGKVLV
jgi:hypothetical protein